MASTRNNNGRCITVANGHPQGPGATKIDDGRKYTNVPTNSSQSSKISNKVKEINMNNSATAWTKKSLETVSFIPSRGENNCAHELSLQKDTRTNCEKCALYSAIVGLIFVLSAIICSFIMKPIVESQILVNLPIINGSETYRYWKDPPVHPSMFMYFFNLTNQQEFLAGREKPKLVEVGPYAYIQNMRKTNISFSQDNSEVQYAVRREYMFYPEYSSGPESDIIVVPNIPLFGAMKKLRNSYEVEGFKMVLEGFEAGQKETPFLTISVKDYLWGYPSVLVTLEKHQKCKADYEDEWEDLWDDPCEHLLDENNLTKMGVFVGFNETSRDIRKINTGALNITRKGDMLQWHGVPQVNYWKSSNGNSCNMVSGKDPGDLPMNIHRGDNFTAFIGQLCRKVTFNYIKEVKTGTFSTYRFTPDNTSFHNPRDQSANECYCLEENTSDCLPSGLLDISGCTPDGNPIYMSWPHFLHGEDVLLDGVDGLSPNPENHSFILDVDPKYGVALSALAKLQLNVIIEKNSPFKYFENALQDKIYYPFAWLQEGVIEPSDIIAEKMTFLLELPDNIKLWMALGVSGLGFLMILPQIVLWFKKTKCDARFCISL